VSGALRRSRNTGHFSSQLEASSAQSVAYTEDFPQKGHIPAVYRAKFAAIRLFRALFTVQGLPSAGTAQKQKRRNGKPHSALFPRAHIPAVFGAKFAAIRLYRTLSAAQGRPSAGAAQKQKRRNGNPHPHSAPHFTGPLVRPLTHSEQDWFPLRSKPSPRSASVSLWETLAERGQAQTPT
jgi:hypothetical protein